ncbi:MAG: CRISPR-associated protein Cas4 [archaeon]
MKELISKEAIFTGAQINYYIICPTKLWLFSHFDIREQDSELVALGRLIQEISFPQKKKDLIIDQQIAIDFIKSGDKIIVNEIKKSSSLEKAHVYQLLYYLYYLKNVKGCENVSGRITYPLKRKIVEVELTPEKEEELKKIFEEIKKVMELPKPPKPKKKKYCRKCSYFEFCWINK